MRLAVKTLSWALVHMIVAIGVAYALTRDWRAALAVGLIEPIFQTVAFVVHERLWTKAGEKPASPFHSHGSPATSAA
jgi:uncharacterized membrane protein